MKTATTLIVALGAALTLVLMILVVTLAARLVQRRSRLQP